MRIIAGAWKGLSLAAPKGSVARPSTDRVKESMFNLLGIDWPEGAAVDLFAGSGALGLEALSRGAEHAYFTDTHAASLRAVAENVKRCRAEERVTVWRCDWGTGWSRVVSLGVPVAWIFVDPPYAASLWDEVLTVIGQSPGGLTHGVVCEHPVHQTLADTYGCLEQRKNKRYGDIAVSLYRRV